MKHTRRRSAVVACLAATQFAGIASADAQVLPPQYDVPAVRSAIAACTADANRLCTGVVPGGGRIVRCLIGQEGSLSPACRDSLLKATTALGR